MLCNASLLCSKQNKTKSDN